MRYAQGWGLNPERQAFRERLRLEAAERFAADDDNALIAKELRVHVGSVQRWYKAWSAGGEAGLFSKGPVSRPILSDELLSLLELELEKGPVAHGWPDRTWTLARITTLIGRRFHKSYKPQSIAALLHRHGWSHQVPARRALERDEDAAATWVRRCGRRRKNPGGARGLAGFEDEAGFSMTLPHLPHLVTSRPDSSDPGAWPIPQAPVDRRVDLLQTGRAVPLIYRRPATVAPTGARALTGATTATC